MKVHIYRAKSTHSVLSCRQSGRAIARRLLVQTRKQATKNPQIENKQHIHGRNLYSPFMSAMRTHHHTFKRSLATQPSGSHTMSEVSARHGTLMVEGMEIPLFHNRAEVISILDDLCHSWAFEEQKFTFPVLFAPWLGESISLTFCNSFTSLQNLNLFF